MSLNRQILFGAAASWFSRAVTMILGLLLLPVLFRTLPKEELGVWILLGQGWATMGILDFGFGITLTRRFAFINGQHRQDRRLELSSTGSAEFADLLTTSLWIYRGLALLSLAVSCGLGFFYLRSLRFEAVAPTAAWTAWAVLCLSQALAVWATPWTCLVQGIGYIGWEAVLASLVSALTLAGQILAAMFGGGLVSLAIVATSGALLQRTVILGFARRKHPELFRLRGQWRSRNLREMLPLALRAWLTALGSALLLYTDQFLIATMEGADGLPVYRAAWVLVHNLTTFAVTLGAASGVFVSHLWQVNDLGQVHRVVERNVRFGWFTMLAGAGVLLFAGDAVFNFWLGPDRFVGYPILIAFLVTETLEAQSYIIAVAARATGDEAFSWCYLLAGALKLAISITLSHYFGLIGVAMGTVIALLITNHWYVPWRGTWRLKYSRWLLISRSVLPAAAWFLVLVAVLAPVRHWLLGREPVVQIVVSLAVVMPMFLAALVFFVLEPGQRRQLWTRIGGTFLFAPV